MIIHSLPWFIVGCVGIGIALLAVGFGIGRVVWDQESRELAVMIAKVMGIALVVGGFITLTVSGFCYAFGG